MGARLVLEPRACIVGRCGAGRAGAEQQKAGIEGRYEGNKGQMQWEKEGGGYLKVKWKNMTALTMAMTVTMATSMPYTQIHLASF